MTNDSPKGAEGGQSYEPGARDRVARWYRDRWGYKVNNETTLKHADDAMEAVWPEVERLRAEYDQAVEDWGRNDEQVLADSGKLAAELDLCRERDALTRKALQVDGDGPLQFAALIVRQQRDKAVAEVSRLREQLAAQTLQYNATLRTAEFQIDDIVCWRGDRWFEGRIVRETAEEDKILDTEQWDLEVTNPGTMYDGVDMTGRPVHMSQDCLVLVQRPSATNEAPEPDEFAMTLRPQLQANSKLEQNLDEGRPSGSERLAPRPVGTMTLVREFHEAFGLPINDTSKTLNKLRADLIREEGREAATALEVGPPEAWAKELADLVIVACGAALTLGIDLDRAVQLVHASNMSKLGPDGRPVMRPDGKVLKGPNYVPPDMSSALLQDAAQAARSEATPKILCDEHCPAEDPKCRCSEQAWHRTCCHSPSPSLRKEGEDRG